MNSEPLMGPALPLQARPSHTLIAADFDELPEVAVAGVNAPLVATTVRDSMCLGVCLSALRACLPARSAT